MNLVQKIILCLMLLAGACTAPVPDLPDSPDKIVIQSEFTYGEDILVYVSKGAGLPALGVSPEMPDSIHFQLACDGQWLTGEFGFDELPFFRVAAESKPGQEFSLLVNMPGEDVQEVKAETQIPYPSSFSQGELDVLRDTLDGQIRITELALDFEISSVNTEKYFELQVSREKAGQILPPADTTWMPVLPDEDKIRVFQESLPSGVRWIRDRESFLIDFYALSPKRIHLTFRIISQPDEQLSYLSLMLKSHTEDGYRFIRSYDQTSQQLPSDFPILVSNIRDGIGIFTAYAVTELPLTVNHGQ